MAFYRHVLASENGLKTNDVTEKWRHWRRSLAVIGRAAYTIYSIYRITAAVYFPVTKLYIRYPKFSFGKVYTACAGNLLYRVFHKMIPSCCFVGKLQKLLNFDTQAAAIRRTFWLSTNLDELTKVVMVCIFWLDNHLQLTSASTWLPAAGLGGQPSLPWSP